MISKVLCGRPSVAAVPADISESVEFRQNRWRTDVEVAVPKSNVRDVRKPLESIEKRTYGSLAG